MKYFALFLMIASLAVFGFGCTETDQPSADPSPAATDDDPDIQQHAPLVPDGGPPPEDEA